MKKSIICTVCPNGCRITAEYTDRDDIEIKGNGCGRGKEYAFNECFDPKRTFTASVKIEGADRKMLPVRTNVPISKDKLLVCAELVHNLKIAAPVDMGQVLEENVLGTGANIVACMTLKEAR